jgi:hypothetical protein
LIFKYKENIGLPYSQESFDQISRYLLRILKHIILIHAVNTISARGKKVSKEANKIKALTEL